MTTAAAPPSAVSRQWPSRRKFRRGRRVDNLLDAVRLIQGNYWLYYADKPMHPAIMRNWSIALLQGACGSRLCLALDAAKQEDAPVIATQFGDVSE